RAGRDVRPYGNRGCYWRMGGDGRDAVPGGGRTAAGCSLIRTSPGRADRDLAIPPVTLRACLAAGSMLVITWRTRRHPASWAEQPHLRLVDDELVASLFPRRQEDCREHVVRLRHGASLWPWLRDFTNQPLEVMVEFIIRPALRVESRPQTSNRAVRGIVRPLA